MSREGGPYGVLCWMIAWTRRIAASAAHAWHAILLRREKWTWLAAKGAPLEQSRRHRAFPTRRHHDNVFILCPPPPCLSLCRGGPSRQPGGVQFARTAAAALARGRRRADTAGLAQRQRRPADGAALALCTDPDAGSGRGRRGAATRGGSGPAAGAAAAGVERPGAGAPVALATLPLSVQLSIALALARRSCAAARPQQGQRARQRARAPATRRRRCAAARPAPGARSSGSAARALGGLSASATAAPGARSSSRTAATARGGRSASAAAARGGGGRQARSPETGRCGGECGGLQDQGCCKSCPASPLLFELPCLPACLRAAAMPMPHLRLSFLRPPPPPPQQARQRLAAAIAATKAWATGRGRRRWGHGDARRTAAAAAHAARWACWDCYMQLGGCASYRIGRGSARGSSLDSRSPSGTRTLPSPLRRPYRSPGPSCLQASPSRSRPPAWRRAAFSSKACPAT